MSRRRRQSKVYDALAGFQFEDAIPSRHRLPAMLASPLGETDNPH